MARSLAAWRTIEQRLTAGRAVLEPMAAQKELVRGCQRNDGYLPEIAALLVLDANLLKNN